MIESPLLSHHLGVIDGEATPAVSGKTFGVFNPATGDRLADVPNMDADQATLAIEAARRATQTTPDLATRAEWLRKLNSLMVERKEELGRIITLEHGKPLREGITEVLYAARFFGFFSGQLDRLKPTPLPDEINGCRWEVHHRPAGVVGAITPWNFPLAMLAKKLAPAIGAGCGVVAKPASETPLSAIAFCELAREAGVPAGMVNVVTGAPAPIAERLCEHPEVRVLSFTGSTSVGKLLAAQSARHLKRLSLELGGNAPFLVFEDADLERAADALLVNKFRGSGQTCVCTNRVYAHSRVHDRFVELVADRVRALKVGDGSDPATDVGPLINRAGFEKVRDHVTDALGLGAVLEVGHVPEIPEQDWGCYYPPTLLTGMRSEMRACREETFGPVVAVASFDDPDDAIVAANSTDFGLAAFAFTEDQALAQRCAAELSFGHFGWNTGASPTPEAPFGGMKQSGYGREGGMEGLLEYCEPQTVVRPA